MPLQAVEPAQRQFGEAAHVEIDHGELRWIDFEDVCRGPAGYDLALLRWMDPTAGDGWADPEHLALCSDLRAVYLASCMVAFRDVFGDDPEWDGYIRWFVSRISS